MSPFLLSPPPAHRLPPLRPATLPRSPLTLRPMPPRRRREANAAAAGASGAAGAGGEEEVRAPIPTRTERLYGDDFHVAPPPRRPRAPGALPSTVVDAFRDFR